jgi:gliding motility-associated-like protein
MKLSLQIRAILTIGLVSISNLLFAQNCPVISSVTSSTAVCAGNSISLQVTATSPGGSPLTYEWFKNGAAIPNTNNFKLDINNFQQSDATSYYVRVSNACNTPTQSANITLTLKDKPSITSFSTSPQTVCAGYNYNIQVSGIENGGGTISYQWKKGTSLIPTSNAATYTLSNIQSGDAALYSVTLSNGCGDVTSSDFQLNVNQRPFITVNPAPVNPILCVGATLTLNADVISATSFKWQKDGTDIGISSKTLTITSVASSNAGIYTFVATNDCGNTTSGTTQVSIKDKPSITSITAPINVCVGATATITASIAGNGDNNLTYAWALNGIAVPNGNGATLVVPNFQSTNAGTYSFTATNSCGSTSSATNNQNVTIQLITTPLIANISNQSVCVNNSLSVATTITNLGSTSPTYQWYFNGNPIPGQTNAQLNISNIQTTRAGRYFVTVNNGCSPTISSNEFNVTVSDAPTIITQPAAETEICSGNSVTLSVTASNGQTYQWLKNEGNIVNANSNTYTINSPSSADAATYKVVISNSCGYSVTSNAAVLHVKSAPSNFTATSTTSLCVGNPHTLQVSAATNNGGSLSYQWKKGGVNILNATSASYSFTSIQTTSAGVYNVDVTNSCGTVTSPDYTIVVSQAPIITEEPASPTLCAGQTVTFTANVTGSTSVKWQRNGADIGITTTSFSIPNISAANAGAYTILATNNCGTTTSAAGILAVNNIPIINSLTTTSPVCAGTTATITSGVSPNGGNNLTYSWSRNGSVIDGANTETLSIANFQSANAGTYALVVSNSCGASTGSSTTTLQLKPAPSVGNIPGPTLCQGNTLTLSPTYTNVSGPNVTYQWYFEGNVLNNQTAAQLNIVNVQSTNAGRYFVTVNNGCIPESGPAINVTVFNLPTIQTQPAVNTEACIGTTATLTVLDNGGQTYQWLKDNVSIPNATTNTLTRSISSTADAGTYKVVVSNGCNYSVTSNNSIITVKSAPTITSSPVNTTVCAGQAVNASVSANTNGGGSLSYLWTSGGTEVPGANSSNFLIERANQNDNGKVYTVAVTNNCGTINGGSFTLSVGDKPRDVKISTSITNKDLAGNFTVCIGSPITFLVESVSNGSSPSYTWTRDDNQFGNTSTNSSISITAATTDAGIYKLKVSNACGITTSNPITISVHEKPIISIQPDATITACENTDIRISGLGQNKPGTNSKIEYSWFYNNNPINGIESNLNLTNLQTNRTGSYILKASNECGITSSNPAVITVVSKPQYSVITTINDLAICSASYQTKTISVDIFTINGSVPDIAWSTKDGSITGSSIVGRTASVTVASVGKDAIYYAKLNNACGTTDLYHTRGEVREEGIKIINEGAIPSVTTFSMPPLTTFCEGDEINLFVTTKSTAPETYTWKLGNTPVRTTSGLETSKNYIKGQASVADVGIYTVDITNKCGTLPNAARIEVFVNPTPVVNFEVSSAANQCLPNNQFNFTNRTTVANGSEIRYVWEFGDGDVNSSAVSTANHSYLSTGTYTVKLKGINNYSCTGSFTRDVTVLAQPRITKQPVGGNVCQGNKFELKAEINSGGASSLNQQWYFNNQPIYNINNTSGNNPIVFTISSMSAANAGTYYLKLTNAQCDLNGESERVNVTFQEKPNPSFTTGGKSLNSCLNDAEYTFINTTTPTAGVSYLWNVSDGTTSTATNLLHKFVSTGEYNVTLSAIANGCSTVFVYPLGNENNKIRVNRTPKIDKDLPSTIVVEKGKPLDLSVTASYSYVPGTSPTPSISYQWYKMPSTTIIGRNDPNYSEIRSAVLSDTGRYYVNVSNSCGFTQSNIVTVKVHDVPSIILQPVATKACIDKGLQLTVNAISNDNSSPLYQWYYQLDLNAAEVVVPNATGPVLNIAKFKASDAGHYYVKVTNSIGPTTSNKVIVTANDIPAVNSIVTSPSIESGICINTELEINASVSDLANSNNIISWEQNGVTLPGQSALQINFASVDKTNQGDLTIKASNSCGTASKTLVINVIDVPQFTQSPNSVTACLEGSANFTAKVQTTSAGTPFSFQWLKNNAIYTGTGITSDEQLSLSNIQLSDAALYALRATNACGLKQSGIGKLTVITSAPSITQQPAAVNICAGLQSVVSIAANPEQNNLTYSWFKNGNLIANEINAQLIFRNIATTDAGTYKAVITNACNLSISSNNFAVVVNDKVRLNETIEDKLLCSGNNLNVDISPFISGATISTTYQWRLNEIDLADVSARTNSLSILNINKSREGKYSIITNNNCGTSTLNLFSVSVNAAPEITTQPVVGLVCEGGSFTNNVIVKNTNQIPLFYQWIKDGTAISNNAISQQLQLQNITNADQGLYAVRVSSSCGTTLSASARLSLIGNPVITLQPTSITSCADIENIITIGATSDDNRLNYKWFKNEVLMPSQISNQLIFSKISVTDIGSYKSVVTNSCGLAATSSTFQVVVNEKVKLKESIADKIVCVGSDFEADLSSNLKGADLSSRYQWKLNGIDIVSSSAKTNKVQLLNVTKSNSGKYSILATNNCGTAIIDLFNLGITNLPVIQTHPVEGTICENLDWTNKVVTSNADQIGFTYQWFKDGAALSGANQPTLLIANTVMSNRGVYSVKLSSACGDVMSQSALLQVRPTPKIDIALVGTPPIQCLDNNSFIFKPNVLISDNSLVDLTWDFGNGVTSKQSQVSHSYDFANDFNVYLFANSIYGCKDTATQVVSVNTKPVITGNIVNQILCTGTQLNYNVDVKLRPNEKVGYQWFFNQDPILNAVNKSITFDNVQKVNGGNYKLRITNACGITYSTEAELKIAEKPIVTVPLPINYKVCENSEMVLKSTIYSLLPNSFQWYKNELPFVGRESDTLRIKQFGTNDVATYSVSITNKCGTTFAVPGNLIMKNIAWSTQALISDTICYETDTKLSLKDFANNDDTLMFSWFKDGEQILGSNSKDFSINKFIINDTGFYAARLSNSCGMLNVPIAKLTLNKVNAAFSLDTLDACKGSLILNGLDTTRSLFRIRDNYWQIKELNRTLGSTPGMRFQFSNSGTYTVRHAVTDMKGCNSDTVSKTVINYGKPTASFIIKDTCMTKPSIALNNSVFGHASTKLTKYTWNFGDTTIIRNTSTVPSYTYKSAGPKSLQLIVESDSSCVADTLTKKLMVYGNPVASFVTQDSCQGFPVLFNNKSFTQFLPDSVVRFSWNFDNGNTSTLTNPQNIFNQYGAYKIKLTAYSASCPFLTDDTTINMTIKIPRANQVYPRIQTVKRVIGQMNAVGNGRSYTWLPFTGLTDTKIKNPKFSIIEDKLTYNITIVDSAGCVNTDKQEVWAFNKPDIYLATGFSPNNDGVNDKYKPEYIEIKILEYFRVQDNNNRQVFITNSLTDKWDGTYNGNPLPPAPYLVTVAGIDILGNRIVKQGIVLVVK